MANKYNAKRTEYNGRTYHSKKEADYATQLDMQRHAQNPKDKVIKWIPQVKFAISINEKHICNYYLDFTVFYGDGHVEHIDVKGVKTPVYKLKKKCVEALYYIEIKEV